MNSYKNVGLIECNQHGTVLEMSKSSELNGYNIKKIFINNQASPKQVSAKYPKAEIVDTAESIIKDVCIDLVIVSSPENSDMDIVSEVLEAGKYVRVI